MSKDIPIPYRLRSFPFYKGYLVHYTVFVGDDGIPDFRVMHEVARVKCARERRCNLCGEKLGKHIVFIGGDLCVKNRAFTDGPMHEDCALYACKVCPFLANTKHDHSDAPHKHEGQEGVIITTEEYCAPGRPDKMVVYYTDDYKLEKTPDGRGWYFLANPPTKLDWNQMPQREKK